MNFEKHPADPHEVEKNSAKLKDKYYAKRPGIALNIPEDRFDKIFGKKECRNGKNYN